MANEFIKSTKIKPAVTGTIANADEYNQNIAGQSKGAVLGIDADGEFEDADIGDENIGTNGALIKDLKVRETNQLEIYNSLGVLIADVAWESLTSPTGAMVPFAMDIPPTGWLEMDGSAVSRGGATLKLFNTIGTRYGVGNGSTTFNIPDIRGETIRGWDHGRGADPDAGSRTDSGDGTTGDNVGTKQADAFASHDHDTVLTGNAFGTANNAGPGGGQINWGNGAGSTKTSTEGGSETRGRNVSGMWCIKL